jgi:hypothetical protein
MPKSATRQQPNAATRLIDRQRSTLSRRPAQGSSTQHLRRFDVLSSWLSADQSTRPRMAPSDLVQVLDMALAIANGQMDVNNATASSSSTDLVNDAGGDESSTKSL